MGTALLLLCASLAACVADPETHERDEVDDAANDAGAHARDASPAADAEARTDEGGHEDVCGEHAQKIAAFVANHRACSTDDDCVIVGDCSHAEFLSVARDAKDEAYKLMLEDPCGVADGPGYYAVCRAGACARERSVRSCGEQEETECPTNTSRHSAGCGEVAPTFREGCHAECKGPGDAAPCTFGYSCQATTTNPCQPASFVSPTCDACGQQSWLCLPVPACQVELLVVLDGGPVTRVRNDEVTRLQLWLQNRTDQTLTLSFELPCHGPWVGGLGDYDLWNACLAGACLSDPVHTELTLAPREKLLWRSAFVKVAASDCNPQGLPSGKYMPTFGLPYAQGANLCGPTATLLLAGAAANY